MRLPENVYLRLGFSHEQFEQAMLLVQQLGSNQAADQAMSLPQGTVARWAKLWIKAQNAAGGAAPHDDNDDTKEPSGGGSQAIPGNGARDFLWEEQHSDTPSEKRGEQTGRPAVQVPARDDIDDADDALRAFRRGAGARSGLSRFAASILRNAPAGQQLAGSRSGEQTQTARVAHNEGIASTLNLPDSLLVPGAAHGAGDRGVANASVTPAFLREDSSVREGPLGRDGREESAGGNLGKGPAGRDALDRPDPRDAYGWRAARSPGDLRGTRDSGASRELPPRSSSATPSRQAFGDVGRDPPNPAQSPPPLPSADASTLEQRSLALSRLDEVAQGLRKLSDVSERAMLGQRSSGDEDIRAMLKLATSMMEFMAKQQEQFLERIQGLEDAQRQVLGRGDPSEALSSRIDELGRAVHAVGTMDQVVRIREEVTGLRDLLEEVLRLAPRLKDSAREVVRLELGEQAHGLGDRLAALLRQHGDAMIESDARMPGALAEVLEGQWSPMFSRLIGAVDAMDGGLRVQTSVFSAFRAESDRREQETKMLLHELKQALDRREQSLRQGLEQQAQAQVQLAQAMHQEDQNRISQLVDGLSSLGRQISQGDQRLGTGLQQQLNEFQRTTKELAGVLQQQGFAIKSVQEEVVEVREVVEGLRRTLHEFGGAAAPTSQSQRLQQDIARLQRDLDTLHARTQPDVLL